MLLGRSALQGLNMLINPGKSYLLGSPTLTQQEEQLDAMK